MKIAKHITLPAPASPARLARHLVDLVGQKAATPIQPALVTDAFKHGQQPYPTQRFEAALPLELAQLAQGGQALKGFRVQPGVVQRHGAPPKADQLAGQGAQGNSAELARVRSGDLTLKKGSTGEAVTLVQAMLNQLQGSNLKLSGTFDSATEKAVKKFRTEHGLSSGSSVGKGTLQALEACLYGRTSPDLDLVRSGKLTLKKGGPTGAAVMAVQNMLNRALGLSLATTGTFDSATEAAVKKFQKAKGITADGKVGPTTLKKLEQAADKKSVATATASAGTGATAAPARELSVSELSELVVDARLDEQLRDISLNKLLSTPELRLLTLSRLTQIDGSRVTQTDQKICGVQSVVGRLFVDNPESLVKIANELKTETSSDTKLARLCELLEPPRPLDSVKSILENFSTDPSKAVSPNDISTLSQLLYVRTRIASGTHLADAPVEGLRLQEMQNLCRLLKDDCGVKVPPMELEMIDLRPGSAVGGHYVAQFPHPTQPGDTVTFNPLPSLRTDLLTGEISGLGLVSVSEDSRADDNLVSDNHADGRLQTFEVRSDGELVRTANHQTPEQPRAFDPTTMVQPF